MGLPRSTYSDAAAMKADDREIVAAMTTICDEFEAYGYRRAAARSQTGHELSPLVTNGHCGTSSRCKKAIVESKGITTFLRAAVQAAGQHKSGGPKTLGQPSCCALNATEVTNELSHPRP